MNFKFFSLLFFCLILAIDSISGEPSFTLGPAVTPPPVQVPKFTECTQFGTNKEHWFTFPGSNFCYTFSYHYYKTWHEAVDVCRSKNASLVSIHDFKTNYILSHPLSMPAYSLMGYFWIGRNTLNSTTRAIYKWSDGTASDFSANISTKTLDGQNLDSNVFNQGRCMAIYIQYILSQDSYIYEDYYDKVGLWYKGDCSETLQFICRRSSDPNVTPAPPPAPTPGGCPNGWYKYGGQKCVKYVAKLGNFGQAQATCRQTPGADMLSIHSQKEQDFASVLTYGLPSPFIGFKRDSYYFAFKWDDQTMVDFTNFGSQPANIESNCVTLVTNLTQPGKWFKTDCGEQHPVVCHIPNQDPFISTGLTLNNKCKKSGFGNYTQFRNSCYSAVELSNVGFAAAEQACKDQGAHLVSIVNPLEESFIRFYLSQNGKSDKYWIGLHSILDSATGSGPVINDIQIFEWTDDWPIFYTNWAPKEPKTMDVPRDQCVYFYRKTGNWITADCSASMAYVCKVSDDKPPQFNGTTNGHCPTLNGNTDPSLNWVDMYKGNPHCYWFSTERKGIMGAAGLMSYSDASFQCRRRNATLASIHSTQEMMLILLRLSKVGQDFMSWIGLSRNPSGKFEWEDNTPIDFMNGLPTDDLANTTNLNDDSGILCAVLKADATWEWGSCLSSQRHYFVCKTDKIYPKPNITTTVSSNPTVTSTLSSIDNSQHTGSHSGISSGTKAGIALGVIAGVALVLIIGFITLKKYRPNSSVVTRFENSIYSRPDSRDAHEAAVSWSKR